MRTTPGRLSSLLTQQDGVVTRAQLRACGVTEAKFRAHIKANRWRGLNDAVVCTHNGPLTPSQGRWAVVLSAQVPVALCGLTGMEVWGVSGFGTRTVHALVRRGARVLAIPEIDVAVHESRRFAADHICPGRSPSTVSLERSVVDAAAWSHDPKTAAAF